MEDQTTVVKRESSFGGVSVRAWLAVLVTFTVCVMSVMTLDIKEPLYTLSVAALSFYFGKSQSNVNGKV